MEQVLFVISAVILINWLFMMVGTLLGISMTMPAPFFHKIGVSFSNTYLSTPAIAYQVYFWANYAGIFNT